MKASLKLLTPLKDIEQWINLECAKHVNKILPDAARYCTTILREYLVNTIQGSEIYRSLVSGMLRAEFGLRDGQSKVDGILKVWANSFKVKVNNSRKSGNGFQASFQIGAINANFSDVLYLIDAVQHSHGGDVLWLKWLLLEGDKIVVKGYNINYNLTPRERIRSRSGDALMFVISSNRLPNKQSYRVPSQYSGVITDNWITQLFQGQDVVVEAALVKAIKDVF